jgi:hypothetical protein
MREADIHSVDKINGFATPERRARQLDDGGDGPASDPPNLSAPAAPALPTRGPWTKNAAEIKPTTEILTHRHPSTLIPSKGRYPDPDRA